MENHPKTAIGIIFTELFNVSLVTYLILLLLETLSKGFVSDFFNLNILLGIVIVSGIVMVSPFSRKRNLEMWDLIDLRLDGLLEGLKRQGISENDFYFMLVMSLGGGFLVFFKSSELGMIAYLLGGICAAIIFILSYLIYTEKN